MANRLESHKVTLMKWLDFLREHRWQTVLCVIALVSFGTQVLVFNPGYMNGSSINQYRQVIGEVPVYDWHPPVFVLVWKVLIKLTGQVASLLVLQSLFLWTALLLLAQYLYTSTKSKRLSLVPFGIALLPFVLAVSGIVYKDTQMVYAILLSLILAEMPKFLSLKSWQKWGVFSASVILLVYATLLRHNAIIAILPLMYMVATAFPITPLDQKKKIGIVALMCVLVVGANAVINAGLHVQKSNPLSSVMLDDITNVLSEQQLADASVDPVLKDILLSTKQNCATAGRIYNSYLFCISADDRDRMSVEYYSDLRKIWFDTILHHTAGYLLYKTETYAHFLFAQNSHKWHPGIDPNPYGLAIQHERLQRTMGVYVLDFGERYMLFAFQPWFWLALSMAVGIWAFKNLRKFKLQVCLLAASSLIYIISYFPFVVEVDYRYIFMSVVLMLFAGFFVLVEKKSIANIKERK